MAQEARWLDAEHFAVGQWGGTLSILTISSAPDAGPVIAQAVNTPAQAR